MVARDHVLGHKIISMDGLVWRWEDTGELAGIGERSCIRCDKDPTIEGYDACLGKLPGVTAACCGHGTDEGFIRFENGLTVRGQFHVDKEDSKEGAR
jgi:hypothetical protein